MFKPIIEIETDELKMAESVTVAKGDGLAYTSGYLRRLVAGDGECRYVAAESKTTGAGETPKLKVWDTRDTEFECDTAGDTSQALVGTKVDATDHDTINQAATSTKIFFVKETVGVAGTRKVRGYFVPRTS